MPLATLLLPPVLLAAAAAAAWALDLAGLPGGRAVAAAAAWLALLVLSGAWFAAGRTPLELTTTLTAGAVPLLLRVDSLTVLFGLAVLAPVALLLTFQRRTGGEAALGALGAAAALGTLYAGSVLLKAFVLGVCASLVLVLLRQEEARGTRHYWAALTAAWLLVAWAALLLDVTGGTSAYGAVPVTALGVPVFCLLALASLLCAGLLPWRTWVSECWARRRLEAGSLAVALLVPLGVSQLVRAYGLGAGQLPSPQLNVALSALGAATALGAAVRAQAASSRRGFLGEAVPLGAGMCLLGLGLGTPLGMVAAMTGMAGVGLAAGLAPLVPEGRTPAAAAAAAALAGVPPALLFGGWLLSVQAALEAGRPFAFLGLAAAGAWLLAMAAAARTARLPALPRGALAGGSGSGALLGLAAALAAGVALAALLAFLAIPAAAEAMPAAGRVPRPVVQPAAILGPGALGVSTASGGWAAALLAGPLVLLALAAAALAHLVGRRAGRAAAGSGIVALDAAPEPLFTPPLAGAPERAVARLAALRVPEQYRSLFRPDLLERAATTSRPWFWAVVTVALAIVVTR